MQTYDMAQTATLIEAMRNTRLHIPTVLAVLCGLRRGEIAALRWRNVDLARAQLAVVESAEQTEAGVRYKEPKSGRARTVALSASVVEELKAHRLQQAEAMLRLGVRLKDESFVAAHDDGTPMQPTFITHEWVGSSRQAIFPGCASTIYATPTQRICWPQASIPRSPASAWATARSGSLSTSTATSCRACRRMLPQRWMRRSGRPANPHRWLGIRRIAAGPHGCPSCLIHSLRLAGAGMEQAAHYRQNAAECLRLARSARSVEQKNILVEMAKTWAGLAKQAERLDRGDAKLKTSALMDRIENKSRRRR